MRDPVQHSPPVLPSLPTACRNPPLGSQPSSFKEMRDPVLGAGADGEGDGDGVGEGGDSPPSSQASDAGELEHAGGGDGDGAMMMEEDEAAQEGGQEGGQEGKYRCGRCGQLKVNHVCTFVVDTACRNISIQTDLRHAASIMGEVRDEREGLQAKRRDRD